MVINLQVGLVDTSLQTPLRFTLNTSFLFLNINNWLQRPLPDHLERRTVCFLDMYCDDLVLL